MKKLNPERRDWYRDEFEKISKEIGNTPCLSLEDFLRIKNYKAQALSIAEEIEIKKQTEKAFEAAKKDRVEGAINALT